MPTRLASRAPRKQSATPRSSSGARNVARAEATVTSLVSTMLRPPPWHIPFTASSTIFGQRSNCTNGRRSKPSVSRSSGWPPSCCPPISPPTQKVSPDAVTRSTSTASSRSASTAAFLRPWYISMVSALRRAGRSMTTRSTPSAAVARRCRDPRSIRPPRATAHPRPAAEPTFRSSIRGAASGERSGTSPASSIATSRSTRARRRSTATPQATAGNAASFSAPSRSM